MPIFIGETGTGKSTVCAKLGLDDWHIETLERPDNEKKFDESVRGAVIVEFAEGTQFGKKTIEVLKSYVDKKRLRFRDAYGKNSYDHPVNFLTITTTNNPLILTDGSGNRRFYPVFKNKNDQIEDKEIWDYSREDMLQLWAEAYEMYNSGYRWDDKVQDPCLQVLFRKMQNSATGIEPPFEELKDYLDLNCKNAGDRIANDELRLWFNDHAYYGKDVENKLQEFAKDYALGFGYKKIGPTTINGCLNKRGFEKM